MEIFFLERTPLHFASFTVQGSGSNSLEKSDPDPTVEKENGSGSDRQENRIRIWPSIIPDPTLEKQPVPGSDLIKFTHNFFFQQKSQTSRFGSHYSPNTDPDPQPCFTLPDRALSTEQGLAHFSWAKSREHIFLVKNTVQGIWTATVLH